MLGRQVSRRLQSDGRNQANATRKALPAVIYRLDLRLPALASVKLPRYPSYGGNWPEVEEVSPDLACLIG